MNNKDELVSQVKELLDFGDKVLSTVSTDSRNKSRVEEVIFHDFRISALSYLSRVFGNNSTQYEIFKAEVTQPTLSRAKRGIAVLMSAEKELQGGWLQTARGTIIRELLIDTTRIAQLHFDKENYTAATTIAGSLLEKQLRELCLNAGIRIFNETRGKAAPKRGLQLSGDAYKKRVISRQVNKNLNSWLKLYEEASTGKEPKKEDARLMLKGINDFISNLTY